MTHYVDLELLPDSEFSASLLMSMLFAKLHNALAEQQLTTIGVSFPEVYKKAPTLGSCLRLHGDNTSLQQFIAIPWLHGMHDYLVVKAIRPVPENCHQHITVRRVQTKSNVDRLRRRQMKRKSISWEEACAAIPEEAAEKTDLPFVVLQSRSTKQKFRFFIEHGTAQQEPVKGTFSAYGLSAQTTVPYF